MADDVVIRLRMAGAALFAKDARGAAGDIKKIGDAADKTSPAFKRMGANADKATRRAEQAGKRVGNAIDKVGHGVENAATFGAVGLLGLGAAGARWGLQFDSQVESAIQRFNVFTGSVQASRQLFQQVQAVNQNSAFGLADLADSAAKLGNAGIKNVPQSLQAVANAASAAGGGADRLDRITVAMSQIAAGGTIAADDINQLSDAGVNVRAVLAREFHLTAQQVRNIGDQGIDSKKALEVLTRYFTSGTMAKAAADQAKTIGGQWATLKDNTQQALGNLALPLARSLERDYLPALNKAATQTAKILGGKGTLGQKLSKSWSTIGPELKPLRDKLEHELGSLQLGDRLGDAFEYAAPRMADAAGRAAPRVASAFASAFIHAGPWGKIATLALIGWKFGAIKALGVRLGTSLGAGVTAGAAASTRMPTGAPGAPGTPRRPTPGRAGGAAGLLAFGPEAFGAFLGNQAITGAVSHLPLGKILQYNPALGAYNATRGALKLPGVISQGAGHVIDHGIGPLAPLRDTTPRDSLYGGTLRDTLARINLQNDIRMVVNGRELARATSTSTADETARRGRSR